MNKKHFLLTLLSLFAFTLLTINLFKVLNNSAQTVTSFGVLDFLQNFSVGYQLPNLSSSISLFQITGEWVILDGLRIFLNLLGSILGVAYYLVSNLIYCITFVASFLAYILG